MLEVADLSSAFTRAAAVDMNSFTAGDNSLPLILFKRRLDVVLAPLGFVDQAAVGALAFSRTGDPATGEFEEALVVLRKFGEVSSLEEMLDASL